LGQLIKSVPDALKVLYLLSRIGGSIDVKELHKLVERLARGNICCREYMFANYPWGSYSKDLEADIEILGAIGLVRLANGGSSRRVTISSRGYEVASRLEIHLEPGFRAAVKAVVEGLRAGRS